MSSAEVDGIGRPRALGLLGGLPYRRGVTPTPLEEKPRNIEKEVGKGTRIGWAGPLDATAKTARGSLEGMIGRWMRFWSRLCLIGVLQCPSSGWGRLLWYLIRTLLAVTLVVQAVAFILTLPKYPATGILFMAVQTCQHFSLLQFTLPALAYRASAFPRMLKIMARTQAHPVFADLRMNRPRFRLKMIYTIAVSTFLFMIMLHVMGGLLSVQHEHEVGDEGSFFSFFPPVVRSESIVVHSLLVILQFINIVAVYAANVLSVSSLHSVNVFLYSHLTHISRGVSKLLSRKRTGAGAVWRPDNTNQAADVQPWNDLLEGHSLLWDLHGELQSSFNECGSLTHLAALLDMCLTSYICIRVSSQYGMHWVTTLVCFGFMLPSGTSIGFEAKSVDIVRNANAAIFKSNYGSSWADLHPRELELANILMQRSRETMQLTAIDLFDISMRNFGAVISLAVTYVIILIQFNSGS